MTQDDTTLPATGAGAPTPAPKIDTSIVGCRVHPAAVWTDTFHRQGYAWIPAKHGAWTNCVAHGDLVAVRRDRSTHAYRVTEIVLPDRAKTVPSASVLAACAHWNVRPR